MVSYNSLNADLRHARDLLSRGEIEGAYRVLGGGIYDSKCEPAIIAGEASSLIRAGLIGEAVDRIAGYLSPDFNERRRYAATGCEAAR